MQIKMYVKEGGIVAFECQGLFKEPLEKVIYNQETCLFSLVFRKTGEIVELDSPVDPEALSVMGNHGFCLMGFCDGNQILGAAMVPMEGVHSRGGML